MTAPPDQGAPFFMRIPERPIDDEQRQRQQHAGKDQLRPTGANTRRILQMQRDNPHTAKRGDMPKQRQQQ